MRDHPPIPAIACPRCDYDLAGTAPDPADGEPRGRCPECGLDFAWSEVRDRLPPPPWSLEPDHRVRWFRVVDRAVRVLWHVLRPATLWEGPGEERRPVPAGLALRHPVRANGLIVTALAGFLAAYLLAVLVTGAVGVLAYALEFLRSSANGAILASSPTLPAMPWPTTPPILSSFWDQVQTCVLVPGVPWTGSSAVTQWAIILTLCGVISAVVMPATFLLLGATLRVYRIPQRHVLRIAAYAVVQWPLIGLLFSLATGSAVLLRGLAEWLQVARAAAHRGLPSYAWASADGRLLRLLNPQDLKTLADLLARVGPVVAAAVTVGVLWVFWQRAASRYLRLPRASLDTTALMVVAVVAGPVLLALAGFFASRWMGLRYF